MGAEYLRNLPRQLTVEEEKELSAKTLAGDTDARSRFALANVPLALKICKSYTGFGVDYDDLVSEAFLGLWEATQRFDVSRGAKFSIIAQFLVRNKIRKALCAHGHGISKPEHFVDQVRVVCRTAAEMEAALGREPTAKEIQKKLPNYSLTIIQRARKGLAQIVSLDEDVGDEGDNPIGNVLADPNATDPSEATEKSNMISLMMQVVETLPEKERNILRLRFGFGGRDPMTLEAIGELIGVTRERIRQIESETLEKVRAMMVRRDEWLGAKDPIVLKAKPQRACPECGRTIVNGDTCNHGVVAKPIVFPRRRSRAREACAA